MKYTASVLGVTVMAGITDAVASQVGLKLKGTFTLPADTPYYAVMAEHVNYGTLEKSTVEMDTPGVPVSALTPDLTVGDSYNLHFIAADYDFENDSDWLS